MLPLIRNAIARNTEVKSRQQANSQVCNLSLLPLNMSVFWLCAQLLNLEFS